MTNSSNEWSRNTAASKGFEIAGGVLRRYICARLKLSSPNEV